MGGFGSGRSRGKMKCESCLWLDVRAWARKGILKAGTRFDTRWSNGSSASVSLASDERVELRYAVDGAAKLQSIALTHTPCNYGGQRTWFVAPCCGSRAAKLFMRRGRFACRKCQNLTYQVQTIDYIQRQHRAMDRVTRKLVNGEDKPKGMHWSTFDRLQDRVETIDGRLNMAANAMFYAVFQRLGVPGIGQP